jgi:hypothetical protein
MYNLSLRVHRLQRLCQTTKIPKEWEGRGEMTIQTISRQLIGGATEKKDQPGSTDGRSAACFGTSWKLRIGIDAQYAEGVLDCGPGQNLYSPLDGQIIARGAAHCSPGSQNVLANVAQRNNPRATKQSHIYATGLHEQNLDVEDVSQREALS